MKTLFSSILVCFLLFSCATDKQPDVFYTLHHSLKDSKAVLTIQARCKASATGTTILLFQDKAWGEDSLQNVITSMKLKDAQGEIKKNRDSNWIEIQHPKDLKTLTFEYTLTQDTKGPLTSRKTYRPIIQPTYFHFFSHNAFVLPKALSTEENTPFSVVLKWETFPEDFVFQNSFGVQEKEQHLPLITESEFHSAVFVGGDFRIHNITIENNTVAFAIRDTWETIPNDSLLVTLLEKTVRSQRVLWQDHTQPYFSVTMIPTVQERGSSFQGTGLTNSFAVNASNNKYLEFDGLMYLFNHELIHNWTGHIIKNEDEEKQYWFSEGFTEYYAFKNIASSNISGKDKSYFIENINTTAKNLYTSPVKDMPNEDFNYESFWAGGMDIQKLPYYRGALFAFYLDNKIHQDSQGKYSLNDLMLAFKEDALSRDQKINSDYFIQKANTFLSEDLKPFFDKHITNGVPMDFEMLYRDFEFAFDATATVFDLGFEFTEDKKSIASIDESSNAYKAGLRKGDVLTSRSYYMGSITHKAEFKKLVGTKEQMVSFYPLTEAAIPMLRETETNKERLPF